MLVKILKVFYIKAQGGGVEPPSFASELPNDALPLLSYPRKILCSAHWNRTSLTID